MEARATRVLDDIPAVVQGSSLHTVWLLKEGYRSSLTVPLYDKGSFIGFLFYDSRKPAVFTASVQRNLSLFSTLINMMISNELNLVHSITASARWRVNSPTSATSRPAAIWSAWPTTRA